MDLHAASPASPPVVLPVTADTTPSGRPQWYGQRVGKEDRSWFSKTGDVPLYAGNTFPTSFTRLQDAVSHAREMSEGEQGAIFVMHPRHVGDDTGQFHHRHPYFLTRSYNAEYTSDRGLYVGQSQFDGGERLGQFSPDVSAVVDGPFLLVREHSHRPHP